MQLPKWNKNTDTNRTSNRVSIDSVIEVIETTETTNMRMDICNENVIKPVGVSNVIRLLYDRNHHMNVHITALLHLLHGGITFPAVIV